jgi:hypothetical protein
MPRPESDRRYYEANREAILERKRLNGKNYRDHKKENETPELRLKRLTHEKKLREALNMRNNQAKLTELESTLLPPSAFSLTPKAFDKLLAGARQRLVENVIVIVDGGREANPVL